MSDADEGRAPLQARIVRDVRTQIEAGVLRDGEALPSTRALAGRFGVSVFTINEAMKTLAHLGLVENVSRSRRVVRNPHPVVASVPLRAPRAVLIGGYAGSGKSELGRILTRLTGWMIIDKDTITRPVVECALEALGQPGHDRDSETYLSVIRPREYEALMATAHENTECGAGAIVTAPFVAEFADPAWLDRERSRFAEDDVPMTVVWVSCDAESMHTYIRRRGAARDAAKLADWDGWLQQIDLDFRPVHEHVVVENSADAEPLIEQAKRLLRDLEGSPSA